MSFANWAAGFVPATRKTCTGKNVHFAETIPGRGGIDYRAYLANITALPFEAPDAALPELPTEYEEGKQYILKPADEMSISLA